MANEQPSASRYSIEDKRLAAQTVADLRANWKERHNLTHAQGDLIVRALDAVADPVSELRTSKPSAWLVPHLIDLKAAGGRVLADPTGEKAALLDGTVVWSAEIFCDSEKHGVIDKNGVTHFAKPLYERSDEG